MAQPIEQAPAWVRKSLRSREEREAQRIEAQAILDAIRRGDRSRVMSVEELCREVVAALHADLLDQRVDESLAQRQRERPVALRPN